MKDKASKLFTPQQLGFDLVKLKKSLELPQSLYEIFHAHKTASGIYNKTPIGMKLFNEIENKIHDFNSQFGHRISCSSLSPTRLYKSGDREKIYDDNMFLVTDQLYLLPTAEEHMIDFILDKTTPASMLPIYFYQTGRKFRKETRVRNGAVRSLEFEMKDGYSFHSSRECGIDFYQKIKKSYSQFFSDLGIKIHYKKIIPESGDLILFEESEEIVTFDTNCNEHCDGNKESPAMEIGHILQLGEGYGKQLGRMLPNGKPIFMCSYGIGITRTAYSLFYNAINKKAEKENVFWLYDYGIYGKTTAGYSGRILHFDINKPVEWCEIAAKACMCKEFIVL